MKYLFIAEKPSSMRAFSDVYKKHSREIDKIVGGTIDFIALRGHVFRNQAPSEYDEWDKNWVELYEELPMIPTTWKLRPIEGVKKVISDLKDTLKNGKYEGIIVGTDSDIEGYGIYYLVCEALGLSKYKTLRFYETALTEKNILQSFKDLDDMFTTPKHRNAINAFIFRSRWDWLIGMNLTTAYSVRYGELIKFGSVKAPTLKLIYDNCNAIDNYKKTITYGVKSEHTLGFDSVLLNQNDKKERAFATKKEAEDFIKTLSSQAIVQSFTRKTNIVKAPKLYSLSDLQIDAAKAPYGYTPDQTLAIAQKLYEEHRVLTYPRTSGNYLSSGKINDLPNLLKSIKGIPSLKPFILSISQSDIDRVKVDKNIINDKEVAKASHDALIPTGEKVDWEKLSKQEQDIFLLVCKRFLSHFLPYFTEEKTSVILDNNNEQFKANGRKTLVNGFYDLYENTFKDLIIPTLNKGDVVDIKNTITYEKVSSPPRRYSMGTIIEAMKNIASQVVDPNLKKVMRESEGIGTEATRANILKDLKTSGYIDTKKNMIYITNAGKRYIESIRTKKEDGSYSYGIADPFNVALWSAQGKQIQLGEKDKEEVLEEFYKYLNDTILNIKKSGAPIPRKPKDTQDLPTCPLCGGRVISNKNGYFCSNFKEKGCKLSIPNEILGKKLTSSQKENLLKGKKVEVKGMKSKAGKLFNAQLILNKEKGKIDFIFS